jgi:hypothetical protein
MDAVATTFASATASPMLRSSLARVIRAHASEPRMALSRLPSRATSRHAATCASKASGDIAYAAPSPNGGARRRRRRREARAPSLLPLTRQLSSLSFIPYKKSSPVS